VRLGMLHLPSLPTVRLRSGGLGGFNFHYGFICEGVITCASRVVDFAVLDVRRKFGWAYCAPM